MSRVPPNPKIYHITHVSNLDSILSNGGLSSDAVILRTGGPALTIGMSAVLGPSCSMSSIAAIIPS